MVGNKNEITNQNSEVKKETDNFSEMQTQVIKEQEKKNKEKQTQSSPEKGLDDLIETKISGTEGLW
jgi:hypothetical protein